MEQKRNKDGQLPKKAREAQKIELSYNDVTKILQENAVPEHREMYLDAVANMVRVGKMFGFLSLEGFLGEVKARVLMQEQRARLESQIKDDMVANPEMVAGMIAVPDEVKEALVRATSSEPPGQYL